MLEGIRRSRPAVTDKRRPITIKMLRGLAVTIAKLCESNFEIHLFRVVVLIMFLEAFQISELFGSLNCHRLYFGGIFPRGVLSALLCSGGPKMSSKLGGQRLGWRALLGSSICSVGPLFQHADGKPLSFNFVLSFCGHCLSWGTLLGNIAYTHCALGLPLWLQHWACQMM